MTGGARHGCASPGRLTVATRPVAKVMVMPPVFARTVRSSFSQRGRQARGKRRSLMTMSAAAQAGMKAVQGTG
ncbi:MAG: hypothetical protein ACRCSO_05165 [Sphingomonas sp.]